VLLLLVARLSSPTLIPHLISLFESMAISPEKLAEYREAFSAFDRDGNGQISAKELQTAMKVRARTRSLSQPVGIVRYR